MVDTVFNFFLHWFCDWKQPKSCRQSNFKPRKIACSSEQPFPLSGSEIRTRMNCHSSDGRGGGKERTFILSKGPIGIKAWEYIRDEMVGRLQLQSSEVLKGYMRSPTSIRRSHGKEGGSHCGLLWETPWEGEGLYRLHWETGDTMGGRGVSLQTPPRTKTSNTMTT